MLLCCDTALRWHLDCKNWCWLRIINLLIIGFSAMSNIQIILNIIPELIGLAPFCHALLSFCVLFPFMLLFYIIVSRKKRNFFKKSLFKMGLHRSRAFSNMEWKSSKLNIIIICIIFKSKVRNWALHWQKRQRWHWKWLWKQIKVLGTIDDLLLTKEDG